MAAIFLFRRFLDILKVLISSCKRLAAEARIRLLQKLAYLWTLATGAYRSKAKTTETTDINPKRDSRPSPAAATTPKSIDREDGSTAETNSATLSTTHDDAIPLDSSIQCSLHPYPYMNRSNASRTSLQHALNDARSTHTSQNASRSTLQLPPSPLDTNLHQEEHTFTVKSPDTPDTPATRRQYSSPLDPVPEFGFSQGGELEIEGEAVNKWGIRFTNRTKSSSPAESVLALPAGVISIHDESLPHDLNLRHTRIFPIMPEFFQRYDRKAFSKKEETRMIIDSFTLDFRPHPDPPGWKPIVHPEGILYFYNEEKKAVTEANLYDHLFYEQITDDIATLESFIRANNLRMPESYTLAMDLNMQPRGVIYTDYYYADHDRKIVFFLDDVETQTNLPVWSQLKGVTSMAHLKHEIEAQYWHHGVLYPSTIELTAERVVELRDVILHYLGDTMTSHYSTSPYSASELNTMLGQANNLQKNVGRSSPGSVNLLSRMMHIFGANSQSFVSYLGNTHHQPIPARQKFLNWHGVPEARIYRDQSVHGEPERKHKTLLIKILSPLLFSAPDVHLASLVKMWVDGLMHGPVWREAIGKLNEEWQEFILYATVLLNANVAYLAIQSIDTNQPGYRSPVQLGCYLSIVASIGSIILGLLLLRQNRTRIHGTMDEVNAFLQARSHPRLGLESLAILYSLPYALLLWG
ncbi:hypothetical protein EST38_g9904 [Candolleomyces aberdarensis]|uniref:Uncharacterized protein n=1 Tax=Candolleomyces aberdarensis TaxID=2316362 RepID=A0A4Q2DAY2_9AGAR|nr:hypothetical protein EST38_g9904 [Candolleomyces aberdarensis]